MSLFLVLGQSGCSDDATRKGQLVLAMQTDMKLPDDVDRIRLEISTFGKKLLLHDYNVRPDEGGVYIPATLGILEGKERAAPVSIQLSARQRGKIRMLREAVTTVPPARTAMLRLPIQWLCDGSGFETAPGVVDSTCPDEQTCISGVCKDVEIDSSTLPDFDASLIFGGGDGEGLGACFDTVACFAEGTAVEVDFGDCSVAVPEEGDFPPSAAILLPLGGDGICGSEACLIPLDADPEYGFVEEDGRLLLPPAVCDRIESGVAVGVAVTRACEQKTLDVPTCGPWSSVFDPVGDFQSGAPSNVNVGALSAPCAPSTSGSESALCLTFEPSAVTPVTEDPTLDGRGQLVVEVYAEDTLPLDPDAAAPTPLRRVVIPDDGTEIGIDELESVRIDGLPAGTVSIFAAFWDNPAETSLATVKRGGGFVAGLDLGEGLTGRLETWNLVAGAGRILTLPMPAIRRLRISTSLGSAPVPDDANGWLYWSAYATGSPGVATVPVGRGEGQPDSCVDLSSGSETSSEGFVIGSGPHYIVASVDEFNLGATSAPAIWSIAGSIVSGEPGETGVWTIPDTDRVAFPLTSYSRSFGVELTRGNALGSPSPAKFHCVDAACTDMALSPTETDIDCGGPCYPCADGLNCAGPADCESRVCTAAVCVAPSCTDTVQNGSETDSDCGGSCTPCADGLRCEIDADCASGLCVVSVCQGA